MHLISCWAHFPSAFSTLDYKHCSYEHLPRLLGSRPVHSLGRIAKDMDADTLRVARDKLLRVFRYLEALNQHRNPAKKQIGEQIWTLWLKNLPDHPSIRRGDHRRRNATDAPESKSGAAAAGQPEEQAFILKVNRPRLTTAPHPPKELESWLERGWEDPSKDISVRTTQNEPGQIRW